MQELVDVECLGHAAGVVARAKVAQRQRRLLKDLAGLQAGVQFDELDHHAPVVCRIAAVIPGGFEHVVAPGVVERAALDDVRISGPGVRRLVGIDPAVLEDERSGLGPYRRLRKDGGQRVGTGTHVREVQIMIITRGVAHRAIDRPDRLTVKSDLGDGAHSGHRHATRSTGRDIDVRVIGSLPGVNRVFDADPAQRRGHGALDPRQLTWMRDDFEGREAGRGRADAGSVLAQQPCRAGREGMIGVSQTAFDRPVPHHELPRRLARIGIDHVAPGSANRLERTEVVVVLEPRLHFVLDVPRPDVVVVPPRPVAGPCGPRPVRGPHQGLDVIEDLTDLRLVCDAVEDGQSIGVERIMTVVVRSVVVELLGRIVEVRVHCRHNCVGPAAPIVGTPCITKRLGHLGCTSQRPRV